MRLTQDEVIKEKLYKSNKHIEKLQDAKEYLGSEVIPLDLDKYLKIDKISSSFIDQLNFRFSKLQDTMGESIFKAILNLGKENIKKMTFLDILNRLEELEILDKNRWLRLREIRNEIAHEYSFNQQEVVDNINMIYNATEELIGIYITICDFIEMKFNIRCNRYSK
ncbi:MAG: toxin-antitoxin system antitoxin subunit [Campylobacterota bacterium]|nr:toxin-antitoxin system antitoxin subunit [Campylobacterota bacterium]